MSSDYKGRPYYSLAVKSPREKAAFHAAQEKRLELRNAKISLIRLAKKYVSEHEAVEGKRKALDLFLHSFFHHDGHEEIRTNLRKKVNADTLGRWIKTFDKEGAAALDESYNNGGLKIAPDVQKEIQAFIWKEFPVRYQDVFDRVKTFLKGKKEGEKVPCYNSIRRYTIQYLQEHETPLVKLHYGTRALRDRNMYPAIGKADADVKEPLAQWQIDSTLCDAFTIKEGSLIYTPPEDREEKNKGTLFCTSDGKRLKLLGLIDVYSRYPIFKLTDHESSLAVGLLIRDAILRWGVPREIVCDNGKPYKNKRVLDFLRAIGVSVTICNPGSPWEKPFIERVFSTLTDGLFRRLPGYSGNSVRNRPRVINTRYTMQELQELIDKWVIKYAEKTHSSTNQRPRERMSEPVSQPRTFSEEDLSILVMEEKSRTVNKGCILYQGGRYFHPKLPDGCKVTFRVNDFDASEVLVYYKDRFLCTAEDSQRKGWTHTQLREGKKAKTREWNNIIKTNMAYLSSRKDLSEPTIVAEIDAAKQKAPLVLPRKADVVSFPSIKKPIESNNRADQEQTGLAADLAGDIDHEPFFTSERHKYAWLRKRQEAGYKLSGEDLAFMEEFRESDFYQAVGKEWERRMEACNEG